MNIEHLGKINELISKANDHMTNTISSCNQNEEFSVYIKSLGLNQIVKE